MYIEKYRIFSKSLFAVKKLLDRALVTNHSTPVKVEPVLELNTKVVACEILHILTKI
jgi:hypothetical protein